MAEPVVRLTDVGVRFRLSQRNRRHRSAPRRWTKWGLRGVHLDVHRGEIVGVIGPNGAGKSTLLRTVAGILHPDEGSVAVSGRVAPLISPTGGLLPSLTGWENVELSTVLLGMSLRGARAVAGEVAELSGLGEFMDAPTRVYSAGMRARLGFALAVVAEPDVLVLDEVMAVTDEEFRDRSGAMLTEFVKGGGTLLFATHEVSTVAESCDRLVRLGEGAVVADGDPAKIAAEYLADAHPGDPQVPLTSRRALADLVRDAVQAGGRGR